MKNVLYKGMMGSLLAASLVASGSVNAAQLPAIDSVVTTVFDKSVIQGSLAHDADGNLLYDAAGNSRFVYSGKIYSVTVDPKTGELSGLDKHIGDITGEAAFPKDFVKLSTAVNGLMQQMVDGTWDGTMPMMPSVVPWTCNHCDMTAGGTHYVSIVDVLDPTSKYYDQNIVDAFNKGVFGFDKDGNIINGATAAFNDTRMKGRAFTAFGPASFDPATRTMGVRMAGCSALVAIDGPNAGKIGTLCMNATAVFNVSQAMGDGTKDAMGFPNYTPTSQISAEGSSNCVTVLQPMQ